MCITTAVCARKAIVVFMICSAVSSARTAEVPPSDLDLHHASIVIEQQTPLLHRAASLIVDKVFERTSLTWPVVIASDITSIGMRKEWRNSGPTITIRARSTAEVDFTSNAPEGYTISANASGVAITGSDGRGALFGAGRLLRALNLTLVQNYYTPRHAGATLALPLSVTSKPDRPMRGVQIGYRPKTNSYDGLTPALFESLVSDLVVFGINQIELISESFDDAPYSPHFSLSHPDMNVAMATVLAKYGVNVSLWYPACHPGGDVNKGCEVGNFHDPTVMAAAKAAWNSTFASLPRLDTLFINAGDPGGQSPDDLVFIAQAAKEVLHVHHPGAALWICPQDWNTSDYSRWTQLVSVPSAKSWLDGVIYGPGMPISLETFRNSTAPNNFPVRLYPDITHSVGDQLPVPNWDPISMD
eukprot:m.709830 g.709830  ORF g.709830 m.709830 type:complete len:415 (-) comp22947_c0_seq2:2661-3905(-)